MSVEKEIMTAEDIVKRMYDLLLDVLLKSRNNTGNPKALDLKEKDYAQISDTIDYIAIKYYKETPDGDRQEEFANDGEPTIDADTAVEEMCTRLHNTSLMM